MSRDLNSSGRETAVVTPRTPSGLGPSGRSVWTGTVERADLDAHRLVLLEEACRLADRLDALDELVALAGPASEPARAARQTADLYVRLVAALRLPDATGGRPQRRGGFRGFYAPSGGRR